MILKIIRYNDILNEFVCVEDNEKTHYVNLFVDGSYKGFGNMSWKKNYVEKCNKLVGRKIEVKNLFTILESAQGVNLLK
jgi:hypothetical protein